MTAYAVVLSCLSGGLLDASLLRIPFVVVAVVVMTEILCVDREIIENKTARYNTNELLYCLD